MSAETSTEPVTPATPVEPTDQVGTPPGTPQATTSELEGNGTSQEPNTEGQTLPDTHPLVKAFAAQKEELKNLKEAGQQSKDKTVSDLATATTELTTIKDELTSTQAKYGRLEAFLTSLGGPISKALDSKSFSVALFESDADIKDLVAQWHRDNPSATSSALNSGAGITSPSKDMNTLLRQAVK